VPSSAPALRTETSAGTPRATPRETARAKDDETLAGVLDSAAGQGAEAQPPGMNGGYVDPRYGDPHYSGPPVRSGISASAMYGGR